MSAARKPLTGRQMAVMNFILAYLSRHACPPTCAEIAEEFGFASPNAAKCHIDALERKGWVARRRNHSSRGVAGRMARNLVAL